MTPTTPDCCDVWPLLRPGLAWFEFADEPGCYAMASIPAGGTAWRVNHCPSCGAERRSAVWNKNTDPEHQP
jgi:hypothetical protein